MTSNIESYNHDRDQGAGFWGRELYGANTIFKWLPVGARFVFNRENVHRPECILIKTKNGYRHEIGGRQWRTGARTACFQIDA